MLCFPQKSSISWVSAMPPMLEPEKVRLPMIRANAGTASGFEGAPDERYPACYAEEGEVCGDVVVGRNVVEEEVEGAGVLLHLVETTTSSAPRRIASSRLPGVVVKATT